MLLVFSLFITEFAYNVIYKPGYILSFYFYIDFVSAISLVPEVLLFWKFDVFEGTTLPLNPKP